MERTFPQEARVEGLCCYACRLEGGGYFVTSSRAEMLAHLEEHEAAGDAIPEHVRRALQEDLPQIQAA